MTRDGAPTPDSNDALQAEGEEAFAASYIGSGRPWLPVHIGLEQAGEAVPTHGQVVDAEIERLLGRPLPPTKRVTVAHEQKLLDRIEMGDQKAATDYITARARTIYTVVSQIPETGGMTIEDYFQIGCQAVFAASQGPLQKASVGSAQYLNWAIRGAIKEATELDWQIELLPEPELLGSTTYEPFEWLVRELTSQALDIMLRRELSTTKRAVLELRFGLTGEQPQTLEKTGKGVHLSTQAVSNAEHSALRRLLTAMPEGHFLQIKAEDGLPVDHTEHEAARRKQEAFARLIQWQRDRRTAEQFLSVEYPGDSESVSREQRVVGGLAAVALKTMRKIARQHRGTDTEHRPYGLYRRVTAGIEAGNTITMPEFIRSLNLLSDDGFVLWNDPANTTVRLTHR